MREFLNVKTILGAGSTFGDYLQMHDKCVVPMSRVWIAVGKKKSARGVRVDGDSSETDRWTRDEMRSEGAKWDLRLRERNATVSS